MHLSECPLRARRLVLTGSAATALAALLGCFAVAAAKKLGLDSRRQGDAFFFFFSAYEGIHFLIVALFGGGVLLWALIRRGTTDRESALDRAAGMRFAVVAALVVAAVAGAGTWLIFDNYPFSMDEFAATFQARIFARGRLEASLSEPWRRFAFALSPIFISIDRTRGAWRSAYLPVYAGIRALFLKAGVEPWTNPVLAGASVLALGAAARRLWPNKGGYGWIAMALLATSPQFLLNSMTAYAMPAYLAFNLTWLILYLRGSRASLAATPWLGVIAMGINNPLPHLLFAGPFLLRLFRSRRWGWASYFSLVYLAGFAGWWIWLSRINQFGRGTSALTQFAFPAGEKAWLQQLMQVTLIFSWLSPVIGLLVVAALASWRRLPEVARDLALGIAATLALYFWYSIGQGHGWGYRYIYAVLGNVVLLAVFGFQMLEESKWSPRFGVVAASAAVALLVEFPLRAREARAEVGPYSRTERYIQSLKGSIVSVDAHLGWYAQDLVRNDPFLETDPKVVFADRLQPKRRELEEALPGRLHELTAEELARFAFPVYPAGPVPRS